MAHNYIGY